jgi:hypothetical protein
VEPAAIRLSINAWTTAVPRAVTSTKLEEIAEKLSRAPGDGDPFEPCRNVRRLSDDRLLLSRARPDQFADNQSGSDADTGLRGCAP